MVLALAARAVFSQSPLACIGTIASPHLIGWTHQPIIACGAIRIFQIQHILHSQVSFVSCIGLQVVKLFQSWRYKLRGANAHTAGEPGVSGQGASKYYIWQTWRCSWQREVFIFSLSGWRRRLHCCLHMKEYVYACSVTSAGDSDQRRLILLNW